MRTVRRVVLTVLFLFVAAPAAAQLPLGAVAPDFTLNDVNGVPRGLSDYPDHVVVLWFVGHD